MKAINVIVSLALIFMMVSCSTEQKSSETYLLNMRLAKGDKFSYDINTDMNMDFMNMHMKMDIGTDFEVLDSTAAGRELRITYKKMAMNMGMGESNLGAAADSIMNKTYAHIIGKSVTIIISDNKIVDAKGFEAFIDSTDTKNSEAFKKMFSVENLNSMFGMIFSLYPGKAVKKGDTWSAVNSMDVANMKMKVITEYKLSDVKDGIAEIAVDGNIDTKGSMAPGDTAVKMKLDIKGTQKGKMFVKISDGYLKNGNYDMDIDAKMDIMDQKLPVKMKATSVITGN